MGSFYVEPSEAISVKSATNAQKGQAFKVWRQRSGLQLEYLGFFTGGSSLYYPAFPERALYTVVGYYDDDDDPNDYDWEQSQETTSASGYEIKFGYDDGGDDHDFNDLTVTCTRIPNAHLLFEASDVMPEEVARKAESEAIQTS